MKKHFAIAILLALLFTITNLSFYCDKDILNGSLKIRNIKGAVKVHCYFNGKPNNGFTVIHFNKNKKHKTIAEYSFKENLIINDYKIDSNNTINTKKVYIERTDTNKFILESRIYNNYNKNNLLTERYKLNSKNDTVFKLILKYNSDDSLILQSDYYYNNNKMVFKDEIKYSYIQKAENKFTTYKIENGDTITFCTTIFNNEGKISEKYFLKNGMRKYIIKKKYFYDKFGKLIRVEEYKQSKPKAKKSLYKTIEFKYNQEGNKVLETQKTYSINNSITEQYIIEYSYKNGILLFEEKTTSNFEESEAKIKKVKLYYDKYRNITKIETFKTKENTLIKEETKFNYTYDEYGNWITQKSSINDSLSVIYQRYFEYF